MRRTILSDLSPQSVHRLASEAADEKASRENIEAWHRVYSRFVTFYYEEPNW